MPSIGSDDLRARYGSPDKIAEAWLEGKLDSREQRFASEVCDKTDLEAARIRIGMRLDSSNSTGRGYIKIFESTSKITPFYRSEGRTNAPIPRIGETVVMKDHRWLVVDVQHDYYDGMYLGVEVIVERAP